jgi:hypothetical protein
VEAADATSSVVQPFAYCACAQSEELGELGVAVLLEVVQDEDFTMGAAQCPQ